MNISVTPPPERLENTYPKELYDGIRWSGDIYDVPFVYPDEETAPFENTHTVKLKLHYRGEMPIRKHDELE